MSNWTTLWQGGREWNTAEAERTVALPCDSFVESAGPAWHRAVDVAAPASQVFRWLCQLRVAPYSYDWIDNGGRRSPPELTPDLEQLEIGQSVMTIFELVDFATDEQLTVHFPASSRWSRRLFGELAVSYVVVPDGETSRLLARLVHRAPRGPWGLLVAALLPLGDLIMMRKQLLTLKRLAEDGAGGHST